MNDKRSIAREIRGAWHPESRKLARATEDALSRLPQRRRRSPAASVAIVAAIVLALAVSMPTIVRAAGELLDKLFSERAQQYEQRLALPEDEKFASELAEIEDHRREMPTGVTAQLDGVSVTVDRISLSPVDYDASDGAGELSIGLTYSGLPPFDPGYIDFALEIDGREVPMQIDENLKQFRKHGGQCATQQAWDGWSDYGIDVVDELQLTPSSNCYMYEDAHVQDVRFAVDDWKWEDKKQLVLRFTLLGADYEIPLVYDPEAAHQKAVEEAKESVAFHDEIMAERRREMEQVSQSAAKVGLVHRAQGYEFAISEMSYVDNQLYINAMFYDVPEDMDFGMFSIGDVYIDGLLSHGVGWGNETSEDGNYSAVFRMRLGRDPRKLPEQSLIKIMVELDRGYDNSVPVAFRYNWREARAILPEDDAQMRQWILESDALRKQTGLEWHSGLYFDLKDRGISQTQGDLTLTLCDLRMEFGNVTAAFEASRDVEQPQEMPGSVIRVDGLDCEMYGKDTNERRFPVSLIGVSPIHLAEVGKATPIEIVLILDGKTFEFDFTIDKSQSLTDDEYYARFQ